MPQINTSYTQPVTQSKAPKTAAVVYDASPLPGTTDTVDLGRPSVTPGDWNGFETFLDKNTGSVARPGSTVEPLIDGQNTFPKMLSAIDHAKTTINWTVFEFAADDTGKEVAKHLADAAARGVQVRLLYDGLPSTSTDSSADGKAMFKMMRNQGVQIEERNAALGHVTHRKILTVDGTTGFIGGMNVGDDYSKKWHDIHSEVTGPAVGDMQHLFVDQWKELGGKLSDADQARMFPELKPTGHTTARIIGHTGGSDDRMKKAYIEAIQTAQKSITLADPYITDEDVYGNLCQAAQRGVDVRVIEPATNDEKANQLINEAHYHQLLSAGVKIYEYNARPMAHDKVAVFDHRVATIGSSNLDALSLQLNDEANVWTDNAGVAGKLEAALVDDEAHSNIPNDPFAHLPVLGAINRGSNQATGAILDAGATVVGGGQSVAGHVENAVTGAAGWLVHQFSDQ